MLINTKIALSAAVILTAAANSVALANDLGPTHKKSFGFYSYGSVVGGAVYPGSNGWRERSVPTYSDPPISNCPALEGYPDCHPQQ
jgi:hypothetical protein